MDRLIEVALGNAAGALGLALIAALASPWIRRPTVVHGIWLLVILRLLVPPVIEISLLPSPPVVPTQDLARRASLGIQVQGVSSRGSMPTGQQPFPLPAPLVVWALGVMGVVAVGTIRTRRLVLTLADGLPGDGELRSHIEVAAKTLGVRTLPRVRVVSRGIPPMIWRGMRGATLVLPQGLIDQLDGPQLQSLIAHEIAHLKRRDHWTRLVEVCASILFWWYPVVWWARRRLRVAEELCCDSLVSEFFPTSRRAYAECLVTTVEYVRTTEIGFAPGPAMSGLSDLKERVTMIMTPDLNRSLPRFARVLLVVVAIAVLSTAPTLTARTPGGGDAANEVVSVEFEDTPLREAIAQIANLAGAVVAIHPSVPDEWLTDRTVTSVQWPLDQALSGILSSSGLTSIREGDVIWVFPDWEALSRIDDSASFSGEPISLALEDADIRDVLATFESLTGLTIEIDSPVDSRVNIHLDQVPWDQALDLILTVSGLTYVVRDDVMIVSEAENSTGEVYSTHLSVAPGDSPEVLDGVIPFGPDSSGLTEPVWVSGPTPRAPEPDGEEPTCATVVVRLLIGESGEVRRSFMTVGTSESAAESVTEAVLEWQFEPSRRDGLPVKVLYTVVMRYSDGRWNFSGPGHF